MTRSRARRILVAARCASGWRRRTPRGSVAGLAAVRGRRRRVAARRRDRAAALAARARSRAPAGGGAACASPRSTAACCSRGRDGGARPARGDRSGAPEPLRAARPGARPALRPLRVHEAALLELPPGRAPPQGAILAAVVDRRAAARPEHGFDERTWLRRKGIHVVLRADRWRIVGRRGGLGGVADRLRARVERSLARGPAGERGAVLAGVVLGDDQAVSESLRDRFRASGLYHLLAVSGQNVAFVAVGVLVLAWLLGRAALARRRSARSPASPRTSSRSARSRRWCAPGSSARSARSRGSPRGQRDRWHFLLLGGARAARLEPVHAARRRLPAVVRRGRGDLRPRSAAADASSRAIRCPGGCARRSRSRRRAAWRPRPCSGSSSTRCRCSRSRRTRSRRPRWRRCSVSRSRPRCSIRSPPGARPRSPGSPAGAPRGSPLRARRSAGCRSRRSARARALAPCSRLARSSARPMLGGDGAAQAAST